MAESTALALPLPNEVDEYQLAAGKDALALTSDALANFNRAKEVAPEATLRFCRAFQRWVPIELAKMTLHDMTLEVIMSIQGILEAQGYKGRNNKGVQVSHIWHDSPCYIMLWPAITQTHLDHAISCMG